MRVQRGALILNLGSSHKKLPVPLCKPLNSHDLFQCGLIFLPRKMKSFAGHRVNILGTGAVFLLGMNFSVLKDNL
jgi:hypothetical protein